MKNNLTSWSKLGWYLRKTLIQQHSKHKHLSQEEIVDMHYRLKSGKYQFGCMYRLFIPKAPGKEGLRPITIPHRLDRALLRALHLTLTDALLPYMSPQSHGFIPNRGCLTLYADLCNMKDISTIKYMDVKKCFDTMNHCKVIEQLETAGAPTGILDLIEKYMRSEIRDKDQNDYTNRNGIGIPQGGAISPMLMNLYLSPIDQTCSQSRYLRYADDIIMVRAENEQFVDVSAETEKLSITLVEQAKSKNEAGEHLGAMVRINREGQITTEINFLKLKKKWLAKAEARDRQMDAMGDEELLKYITSIMNGVALYYGSISVQRERTLKFIRSFHTHLAWTHLLRRHTFKEITQNDKLYCNHTLRIPTYEQLRSRVDRLCLSIQISKNLWLVRMKELTNEFLEKARKVAKTKQFGLFTMSQEKVVELYLMHCKQLL